MRNNHIFGINSSATSYSTFVFSDNSYISDFQLDDGTFIAWSNIPQYASSEVVNENFYEIYFDFMMPVTMNGVPLGDKRQQLWIYIDLNEIEQNNNLSVTYKHKSEIAERYGAFILK